MSIKVGTTDIATVGKIKLGTSNITKVYQGTTQIWPVGSGLPYNFGAGYTAEGDACLLTDSYGLTLYTDIIPDNWDIYTQFFTDATLTTPYFGNEKYRVCQQFIGAAILIDNDGWILEVYNCGF
jgi:hypothetical protein